MTGMVPQGLPYSPFGYYGYAQDPLFQMLAMVPPMWRPQQMGETFGVRVLKNLGLTLVEQFLSQLMLATRQAFLPPALHARDATIDVGPSV